MRGVRMLARGRRFAESRMTETVTIALMRDGTGLNGEATRVADVTRYSGEARVKYPSYAVAEMSPRTQALTQQDVVVSLPVGSGPVFEGDEVLVTSSAVDGELVGRRYTVVGRPVAGQTTAYRVTVIEQS